MKCTARQHGDQMSCEHGIAWDMNDPEPPACSQQTECPNTITMKTIVEAFGLSKQLTMGESMEYSATGEVILEQRHTQVRQSVDHVTPDIYNPPLFDGVYINHTIKPGVYKSPKGFIVTVEHDNRIAAESNRVYTEYTPSGKRLRQVRVLPSKTEIRYPTGLNWGDWRDVK